MLGGCLSTKIIKRRCASASLSISYDASILLTSRLAQWAFGAHEFFIDLREITYPVLSVISFELSLNWRPEFFLPLPFQTLVDLLSGFSPGGEFF